MRILHIVHQYPPEHVGGTELYTQTLARYQARRLGHDVAVLFPSEQEGDGVPRLQVQEDGVRAYPVPLGPRSRTEVFFSTFAHPAVARALDVVLARERPDLVHVQHLMGLPAGLVPRLARSLPVVITLHDYWFPCANAQLVTNYDHTVCAGPNWWLNCARCALARSGRGDSPWLIPALAPLMAARSRHVRGALAQARRAIAPTHFVRDTYAELGMPADHITVVPHGIEVPDWVQEESDGESASRPGGPLHVVYVGSVAWQKGVHVLVDAVNDLADVRLTVYGSVDTFPDYAAQLKEMASHPGIIFAGHIGRDALWRALRHEADVLVVPSIWYETASLVVQEAFAAGVPVVASRLGALVERVHDGVDGLLFRPGDAAALRDVLRQLRDDPALRQRLRQGIQPARLMDDHVRDVMAVYEAVRP